MTALHPIRRHAAQLSAAIALLAATPSQAQNELVNPNFDSNIAGWSVCADAITPAWSANDAAGNANSGSLRLVNTWSLDNGGFPSCSQCRNVSGPATYRLSGKARVPAGQSHEVRPALNLFRYAAQNCAGEPNSQVTLGGFALPTANWTQLGIKTIAIPASGGSFLFYAGARKVGGGGEGVAFFDELRLCRNNNCDSSAADGWLTSSEFPDFRFRVQFTTGSGPFYGAKESDCLPDTLCVSSELVGRTAVLLRIIGPRPNGYLWFQATRFPAQQVDIEVQQLSTGIVKTYRLDRLDPDDTQIPGRLDRTAFLP